MESDKAQIYKLISDRRTHWDNLQWQIPSLTLSGEAFLFSVAFDVDKHMWARIVTAGVAAIVAIACILTMSRFRVNEIDDSETLELLERELGLPSMHGRAFSKKRQEFLARKSRIQPLKLSSKEYSWKCFIEKCGKQHKAESRSMMREIATRHLEDKHQDAWSKPRIMDLALMGINKRLRAFDVWIWIFTAFIAMSGLAMFLATLPETV